MLSAVAAKIGAPGFEPGTSPTRTVRATRLRHAPRADILGRHTPGVASARQGGQDQASKRLSLRSIAITLTGIAALTLLVLLVEPLRSAFADAVSGDTASLRHDLRGLGAGGGLIVLTLALVHSFVWYPTEILNAATGFVYGFWVALPLLMAAWMLNGVACWAIGRYAARPLLVRWLGDERLTRYETAVRRGGAPLLIGVRLVPVIPFSLTSYAMGSASVPLWRFMWTTFVGYLPLTAVFAYLGSRLEEFSLEDPLIWIGALAVVGMLLLTRRVVRSMGLGDDASPNEGSG
jgi:uncharacterized membrane protein YdjX (TVP38/TMEM64 family)